MDKGQIPDSNEAGDHQENQDKVFDYRGLRLVIGILAISLPLLVWIRSSESLPSISASYHTESRDIFVGILFFVAAFLFAYKGHFKSEARVSTVACFAAVAVACFPTTDGCSTSLIGWIHYGAAIVLFAILAYFCFGPFRRKLIGTTGKKWRRERLYFWCGISIVVAMAAVGISTALPCEVAQDWGITFWAEVVALVAFGVAWIVSGKAIPALVDENERYRII